MGFCLFFIAGSVNANFDVDDLRLLQGNLEDVNLVLVVLFSSGLLARETP
jgi:hypothetical protein